MWSIHCYRSSYNPNLSTGLTYSPPMYSIWADSWNIHIFKEETGTPQGNLLGLLIILNCPSYKTSEIRQKASQVSPESHCLICPITNLSIKIFSLHNKKHHVRTINQWLFGITAWETIKTFYRSKTEVRSLCKNRLNWLICSSFCVETYSDMRRTSPHRQDLLEIPCCSGTSTPNQTHPQGTC